MILRRIEITLTGPDDYPSDEGSDEKWSKEERQAMFLFADHVHIAVRQLKAELPEEYDIEVEG